jgi:hypothetical protein
LLAALALTGERAAPYHRVAVQSTSVAFDELDLTAHKKIGRDDGCRH